MNVQEYLQESHVDYDILEHRPTYDGKRLAATLHVPGGTVAKTVLLRADHSYAHIVAVLPANMVVDLQKVGHCLNGAQIELAPESEIVDHCPDCERGVLPPFGSRYGMETIVDASLANKEWIVFEGNEHSEAVRIRFEDFKRLEKPLVQSFAREPVRPK